MKISDITKKLQIKRPPIFKNKGRLRILGAGSKKRHIKIFRPIQPGAKHGHGNKKNRRHRGKGFGMLTGSVAVPLLMKLINKL